MSIVAQNETHSHLNRMKSSPSLAPLVTELLWLGLRRDDLEAITREAFALMLPTLSGDYAALYQARAGRWEQIAEVGVSKNCPADLLAEVLDCEQCVINNNWAAMLLAPRSN